MTSSFNTSSAKSMNTLSLTLTNTRVIDGLIFAANSAGLSPEAYAEWLLTQDGHRFADANSYGVITSAAFVGRLTPTEYGNILAAAANDEDIKTLLDQLFAAPTVALDDERVTDGLQLLVSRSLLDAARPAEILFYARPFPQDNDTTEPDGGDV
jgi:hypothetical protein